MLLKQINKGLFLFQRVCLEILYSKTDSEASNLLKTLRERPLETWAIAYLKSLSSSHYKGTINENYNCNEDGSGKEDQFQHITLIRDSGFWKKISRLIITLQELTLPDFLFLPSNIKMRAEMEGTVGQCSSTGNANTEKHSHPPPHTNTHMQTGI